MRSCNSTRGSVGRSVRHTRVEFLNKAVYTTAPVAGSWAGAVMIWAGAYSNNKLSNPLNAQKCKKSKVWRTDRPTDRPTDTVTYRSRARDKKCIGEKVAKEGCSGFLKERCDSMPIKSSILRKWTDLEEIEVGAKSSDVFVDLQEDGVVFEVGRPLARRVRIQWMINHRHVHLFHIGWRSLEKRNTEVGITHNVFSLM